MSLTSNCRRYGCRMLLFRILISEMETVWLWDRARGKIPTPNKPTGRFLSFFLGRFLMALVVGASILSPSFLAFLGCRKSLLVSSQLPPFPHEIAKVIFWSKKKKNQIASLTIKVLLLHLGWSSDFNLASLGPYPFQLPAPHPPPPLLFSTF